jgi:membrane protein YdbS with pleckstrin-like domain
MRVIKEGYEVYSKDLGLDHTSFGKEKLMNRLKRNRPRGKGMSMLVLPFAILAVVVVDVTLWTSHGGIFVYTIAVVLFLLLSLFLSLFIVKLVRRKGSLVSLEDNPRTLQELFDQGSAKKR